RWAWQGRYRCGQYCWARWMLQRTRLAGRGTCLSAAGGLMALDPLGKGRVAEVFADGEHVLKLYAHGFGPEQAQREAAILEVVDPLPISCPTALGVVEIE